MSVTPRTVTLPLDALIVTAATAERVGSWKRNQATPARSERPLAVLVLPSVAGDSVAADAPEELEQGEGDAPHEPRARLTAA